MTRPKDTADAARRIFNAMPDPMRVTPEYFDHETACGLILRWAKKGVGFGEVTIAVHKLSGNIVIDDEEMGMAFLGETFRTLAGQRRKQRAPRGTR
jgi:hypothetical protein